MQGQLLSGNRRQSFVPSHPQARKSRRGVTILMVQAFSFFFFFFTQPWRASINLRAAEGHRHLGRWRLQRGAAAVGPRQKQAHLRQDQLRRNANGKKKKKNVPSVSQSRWFCMSGWDEMLAGWLRKWWVCHTDARGLFAPSPQAFLGPSITT